MIHKVAGSAPQGQSRPVDPLKLKSKARLRLELELSGLPQKALAYGIPTTEPQLTRYLGDQYSDDLPSYKVPGVVRELGPGYMEWLALQCGGTYHHGEMASIQEPVHVLVGLLARESGLNLQALIQDLADRDWTPEERQAELGGLRRLLSVVQALIHSAEGGAQ